MHVAKKIIACEKMKKQKNLEQRELRVEALIFQT